MTWFAPFLRLSIALLVSLKALTAFSAPPRVDPTWKLAIFVAGVDDENLNWFRDSQYRLAMNFAVRGWEVRILVPDEVLAQTSLIQEFDLLFPLGQIHPAGRSVRYPVIVRQPRMQLLYLLKSLNQAPRLPQSLFIGMDGHGSEPDFDTQGQLTGHQVLGIGPELFSQYEQEFATLRHQGSRILVFDETCYSGASLFLPIVRSACVISAQNHRWVSRAWQSNVLRKNLAMNDAGALRSGTDFFRYVLEANGHGSVIKFDVIGDDELSRGYFPQMTGFQTNLGRLFELLLIPPSRFPNSSSYRPETLDQMESAINQLQAWGQVHSPRLMQASRIEDRDSYFRRVVEYHRLRSRVPQNSRMQAGGEPSSSELASSYNIHDQTVLWLLHRYQQSQLDADVRRLKSSLGANPSLQNCVEFKF